MGAARVISRELGGAGIRPVEAGNPTACGRAQSPVDSHAHQCAVSRIQHRATSYANRPSRVFHTDYGHATN